MAESLAVIDEESALSTPGLNRFLRENILFHHNISWQKLKREQFGLDAPNFDTGKTEPPSAPCSSITGRARHVQALGPDIEEGECR